MICEEVMAGRGASRAEQRRHTLLDAARALFVENGFHATGMAQIARRSGIAIGQIYRDFSSKEDIVSALVETDCATFMQGQTLSEAIEAGDAAQVRQWLHHLVERDEDPDSTRLFAEIIAESARTERVASIMGATKERSRAQLLSALALLAPGDALEERRQLAADVIMTFSLGLLNHQLVNVGLDVPRLSEALRGLIDEQVRALTAND